MMGQFPCRSADTGTPVAPGVFRRDRPARPGDTTMPTLNRFPLLGLWAEEAARRVGYARDEAESLGHAYAVLYAIRARERPKAADKAKEPAGRARKRRKAERLRFGGDDLEVTRDAEGKVRGLVGGE